MPELNSPPTLFQCMSGKAWKGQKSDEGLSVNPPHLQTNKKIKKQKQKGTLGKEGNRMDTFHFSAIAVVNLLLSSVFGKSVRVNPDPEEATCFKWTHAIVQFHF